MSGQIAHRSQTQTETQICLGFVRIHFEIGLKLKQKLKFVSDICLDLSISILSIVVAGSDIKIEMEF